MPRPNDFSDFAEYFVRKVCAQVHGLWIAILIPLPKALISAISQVRFDTGKTPPQIRQFLIDQLRYNDNTSNLVSYQCTLSKLLPDSVPF